MVADIVGDADRYRYVPKRARNGRLARRLAAVHGRDF
jgi:hypothetical protein